jgi:hypothetical protein
VTEAYGHAAMTGFANHFAALETTSLLTDTNLADIQASDPQPDDMQVLLDYFQGIVEVLDRLRRPSE